MQATPKYPGGRSQALMPLCSEASGEEAGKDRRTLNSPPRHRRGQFFWVRGTVHWGKTFTVSKAASICQQQAVRLHSASASEESGPGQAETVSGVWLLQSGGHCRAGVCKVSLCVWTLPDPSSKKEGLGYRVLLIG